MEHTYYPYLRLKSADSRGIADTNFRIRASLIVCSSRPSATRRQTDAISLLSNPCADPMPLRLIVSYIISPSPLLWSVWQAVVYCSVSQVHYCSRSVGLTFKLNSNPYAIQQLGVQRPNKSQFVPWIIN